MFFETHDFIDDTLVGVEVEGETRVADGRKDGFIIYKDLGRTYYFSINTREALLVVLVRTRPYKTECQLGIYVNAKRMHTMLKCP